jgi:MoaA/NifB/PqqE/SkfB family radical SAM enzyme
MTKLCSLAWTGFYNEASGIAKPCCLFQGKITKDDGSPYYLQKSSVEEIFNSKYMKELRQRFHDGSDIPECRTCWTDEANGYRSKREMYLKQEDEMVNRFGVSYSQVDGIIPSDFQLIISNACNIACKTCSPSHSSMWQGLNKKIIGITKYDMPYSQVSSQDSMFWNQRATWLNSVVNLEMVGGEPFYISKWEQVIDELIEIGRAKEVSINFSSNLTIYNEELLLKMLDNFKIVSMSFSIDGIGRVQEYIRHPITWDQTLENLRKYQSLLKQRKYKASLVTQICHTISWYNVLFVPQFIEYMTENFGEIPIWLNLVHYPEHLSVPNAPTAIKQLATERINALLSRTKYDRELKSLIEFMNAIEARPQAIEESMLFIETQDKAREMYLVDMIPELQKLL